MVDIGGFAERLGQIALQRPKLRLQGADAVVELALGEQVGEILSQMDTGEAAEIPLAAKAGPLRQK